MQRLGNETMRCDDAGRPVRRGMHGRRILLGVQRLLRLYGSAQLLIRFSERNGSYPRHVHQRVAG